MIRIWQAYACNNSSAYRIIARFSDRDVTAEAARAVRAQLAGRGPGEEAEIFVADQMIVVCDYEAGDCAGLAQLCEARGAKLDIVEGRSEAPSTTVTVLCAWNPALADIWEDVAHYLATGRKPALGWRATGFVPTAAFRDADTVGLHGWIYTVDGLRGYLETGDVLAPSITLCEDGDKDRFRKIAAARCSACGGPLCYLDPRLHDIETPQLLCKPCGGLYDLGVLT